MKVIVEGSNASLYLDSIKMTGGIPGEGMFIYDFYLKRGDNWQYVSEEMLLATPEIYFPSAGQLCSAIRKTKKKDIKWTKWVKEYNKIHQ